jgi:TPR repeat protein
MAVRIVCAALAVCGLGLHGVARADFSKALKDYNAGQYESAHAQFLALAELGDCPSQFNLGAMALKGQGVPKDRGAGVGWLQAALSNGCREQVGDRVPALAATLTPEESRAAAAIMARYGHDALQSQGVLSPTFECRDLMPAAVLDTPTPEYPKAQRNGHADAIVITAFTIGVDGLARDPEILLATPTTGFPAAAVEAWLNSRFAPAQRHGVVVESRLQAKLRFMGATGSLANATLFKTALPAAQNGDPAAQYTVGLAANFDPSLGVTQARSGQLLISSARAGNPDGQYWVASQVRAAGGCQPPASGTTWLRHAAESGSPSAQVVLAQELLKGAPSAAQVSEARALLASAGNSDSYYVQKHAVALLAASPVAEVNDPAAALRIANKLLAGEIQSDPQMFEAVAAAYAANKDFDLASAKQDIAVKKARTLGWNTRLMKERLSAYEQGHPWSGDLFALPPLSL